jgi:hypothetical protein
MRKWLWQAVAAVAAVSAAGAGAQLYKCKGPDGKIVYSDSKCEASATGDAIKVIPMGTTKSEREKAMDEAAAKKAEDDKKDAEKAAERRAIAKEVAEEMRGSSSGTPGPAPYELTSADRSRISELQISANSLAAHSEQREAANMQISRIRRGAEAKMSASDRERRDALVTDLASADTSRRKRALSELRANYQ